MPRTRAEWKAELTAEAERLIDELLAWTEQTEAPDLTAIEDQVLKLRKQFGEKLAEAVVKAQPTAEPLTVVCPECGRPMHQKRRRPRKQVESRVGRVDLKRAYYYCSACRVGLFPPGPATDRGTSTVE